MYGGPWYQSGFSLSSETARMVRVPTSVQRHRRPLLPTNSNPMRKSECFTVQCPDDAFLAACAGPSVDPACLRRDARSVGSFRQRGASLPAIRLLHAGGLEDRKPRFGRDVDDLVLRVREVVHEEIPQVRLIVLEAVTDDFVGLRHTLGAFDFRLR